MSEVIRFPMDANPGREDEADTQEREQAISEMLEQEEPGLSQLISQTQAAEAAHPQLTVREQAIVEAAGKSAEPTLERKIKIAREVRHAVEDFYTNFDAARNRPNEEMRFEIAQRTEVYQRTFNRMIAQIARPRMAFRIRNENGVIFYKYETGGEPKQPKRSWFFRKK